MKDLWHAGDQAVLRGVINGQVWEAMSVIVVKDTPAETALLLRPNAQCAWADTSRKNRWTAMETLDWSLKLAPWSSNWFLMLLEPRKYHATYLIWNKAEMFTGYYVNFQMPFCRTRLGFDSLDLELDLVVNERLQWYWKDEADYEAGIETGGIHQTWVQGIEQSRRDIISKISQRQYPFDGAWLDWHPSPSDAPPRLPSDWCVVG